jgi:hypothetical protein
MSAPGKSNTYFEGRDGYLRAGRCHWKVIADGATLLSKPLLHTAAFCDENSLMIRPLLSMLAHIGYGLFSLSALDLSGAR